MDACGSLKTAASREGTGGWEGWASIREGRENTPRIKSLRSTATRFRWKSQSDSP